MLRMKYVLPAEDYRQLTTVSISGEDYSLHLSPFFYTETGVAFQGRSMGIMEGGTT